MGPFVAAVAWSQLPGELWNIFYGLVLPVLLIAGVGYLLQKTLTLDLPTLTRLNFYLVVPAIVYVSIVNSAVRQTVTPTQVGLVLGFAIGILFGQMLLGWLLARLRGLPPDRRNVLMMTGMFNNSGNYGLPLQELAMGPVGRSLQVFYMVVQNVGNFTLGVLLAAGGRKDRHWRQNLLVMAKFPPLYALAAALATIAVRRALGEHAEVVGARLTPFWKAVEYMGQAMIAVALCTLGAQLAAVRPTGRRYTVKLSVALRLLMGPALGLAIIYGVNGLFGHLLPAMGVELPGLRIEGFLAAVLLISSSTPTAVNCLLLCLEFDNHPDYAAQAVFYSTLLSPLTVTLTIFLAKSGLLPGF